MLDVSPRREPRRTVPRRDALANDASCVLHADVISSASLAAPASVACTWFTSQAFGLRWRSDAPLAQFHCSTARQSPWDVLVVRTDRLIDRPGGRPINNGVIYPDGARFRFADVVFDTFDGERVTWWSPTADSIPTAFFGTVAAIVLAWRGLVPIHGSAVAIDGEAVLIAGPPGAGKSTLCAALVDGGGRLVSDDLSVLSPTIGNGKPMLLPGRAAIRLIAAERPQEDKLLYRPAMVEPERAIPLRMLVLLRNAPIAEGPSAATEALHRQLFRPSWMRALPGARARSLAIFRAAQKIEMITAPSAWDRTDLPVEAKARMILDAWPRLPRRAVR